MKTAKVIAKIAVALTAVAGAVYIVATYGEQIVAWCKKMLASLPCQCKCENAECVCEATEEPAEEAVVVEEVVAEEAVADEPAAEEAAEEPAAEEAVAEEADFEN